MSAPAPSAVDARALRPMAAALLAAVCSAAWLESGSATAAALRSSEPYLVWLRLGTADHLLAYSPARATLQAAYLPPGSEARAALEEAQPKAPRLEAALPAGFGAAEDPEAVAEWLEARGRGLSAVLAWPRALATLRAGGLSFYDAALLLREAGRVAPGAVTPWWLGAAEGAAVLLSTTAGEPPRRPGTLTVRVLNASGEAGVALQATKVLRLRGRGLDVVEWANASAPAGRTRLTDATGSGGAREVAEVLGCPGARTLVRVEPRPRAAVTVELGHDYARCAGLSPRPAPGERSGGTWNSSKS